VTTPAQLDTAARAGIAKPAATSGRVHAHARGRPERHDLHGQSGRQHRPANVDFHAAS